MKIITERTPFYLIGTIFLLITIVLSILSTLYTQNNCSDFFPVGGYYRDKYIHDNTIVDKLCWYFSQLTHHTIFLMFTYFFMALLNCRSVKFFKIIAPLALTISVLYFYFLFPKQKLKIHQLPFANFFSHFMIIFLVFGELMYIKEYTFQDTTNCLVFIVTALLFVYINYCLRSVWSYNLICLDKFSGWKLVSIASLIMYLFSLMFYFFKYNTNNPITFKMIKMGGYTISSFINIIFFLWFSSTYN
jgi:hypothetical protein